MAPRARRRESELAFEALSIEGGLLAPEWLARVAQLQAGQQSEEDYRIPKGLSIRDEIGRYWRVAQAHWKEFAAGRQQAGDLVRTRALSARFVRGLLVDAFGFTSMQAVPPVAIDGRTYPIPFAALGGRVPVVAAPAGEGVDVASPTYGDGGRRRSPFGLVQEFLNAAPGSTWGLVSDGCVLRIARDNASLTRPAWIEADLVRIFQEERYADFAELWLLAHESRFGRVSSVADTDQPSDCALEAWRAAGREEGTRARDALRDGFEDALLALGQGFLSHPGNTALRESLQRGAVSKEAYFQELLRLVYRLIFLLTVEERGLLHAPGTPQGVLDLYREGYSVRRLRDRAIRRNAHDRLSDLWQSLRIVFRGLAKSETRLGLPALGGLFASELCASLEGSAVQNRFLLHAIFRLSWLRQDAGIVRVNWRDMGPEELGSVYEGLLELSPEITDDGRAFSFASVEDVEESARRRSGTYYTPDDLVQALLDNALEPVIADTLVANPQDPAEALLKLSIVDPACGSGHFLLSAARRIAAVVARHQEGGTPSSAGYRKALRQVIGHCVFGVDQNPMAVELCKASLWMEALDPGLPLTFLDSHIQHGNALLGATPDLLARGIPTEAWAAGDGDDRAIAAKLKRRNEAAAFGQRGLASLWSGAAPDADPVSEALRDLDAEPDLDIHALVRKERRWDSIRESTAYLHGAFVADSWCASFFWPKTSEVLADAAPTNDLWLQIRDAVTLPPGLTAQTVSRLRDRHHFFHWHLAFSQVFARGKFDLVVGNPPWLSLSGRFSAGIADDNALRLALFRFEANKYMPNTYEMFVRLALELAKPGRPFAFVLPDRIASNVHMAPLRETLLRKTTLTALLNKVPFPGVTADVIGLVACVEEPTADHCVKVQDWGMAPSVHLQSEMRTRPGASLQVLGDRSLRDLIQEIESGPKTRRLSEVCKSTSGFGGKSALITATRTSSSQIEVLKGESIVRFGVRRSFWFDFKRENLTGRTTDTRKLGAVPKILLRKTGSSIVATYDDTGRFPEQSLYFLFELDPLVPPKFLLGVLNSRLIDIYFRSRCLTNAESIAQVKKVDLDALPIIWPDESNADDQHQSTIIVEAVDALLAQNTSASLEERQRLETEIDDAVCRLYRVAPERLATARLVGARGARSDHGGLNP